MDKHLDQNTRKRLLVPIKDNRTGTRFRDWLSSNPQFWSAEIRVFSILEPLWFHDIPYSASQAHMLINEQSSLTAQARHDLAIYCEDLRNTFHGLHLTSDVYEGHVNAKTILSYAKDWHTDCILILSTRKNSYLEWLRLSLAAQVLHAADCMVLVVQTPTNRKHPSQIPSRQPSVI